MRTKNTHKYFPEVIPNISANQSAAIEAERSSSDLGLEIIITLIINLFCPFNLFSQLSD